MIVVFYKYKMHVKCLRDIRQCGDELGIIVFPYHRLIVTAVRSICV